VTPEGLEPSTNGLRGHCVFEDLKAKVSPN